MEQKWPVSALSSQLAIPLPGAPKIGAPVALLRARATSGRRSTAGRVVPDTRQDTFTDGHVTVYLHWESRGLSAGEPAPPKIQRVP